LFSESSVLLGVTGFFVISFTLGFLPHTQIGKSLGQVQGEASRAKAVLTILSSSEWKVIHRYPSALVQKGNALFDGFFKYHKLFVDLDSDSLEAALRRMSVVAVLGGYCRGNNTGKLQRCPNRAVFPFRTIRSEIRLANFSSPYSKRILVSSSTV
jgi:hypothetical protein